jgi:hypothetical protein
MAVLIKDFVYGTDVPPSGKRVTSDNLKKSDVLDELAKRYVTNF